MIQQLVTHRERWCVKRCYNAPYNLKFTTDPGVLALLERSHVIKAEKYGVSPVEIRSKVFGAYKRVGRAKTARIAKNSIQYKAGDEG